MKVIILTESQVERLLTEQVSTLGPVGGYDYQKPEMVKKSVQTGIDIVKNMDPHTRNSILGLGAAFIPLVGPAITAGIAAYDASLYYNEGKKKEAGLSLVLGLLPGVITIANKIPGVKQLGIKGMSILADKIAKGITKLTPLESEVVQGINLNKSLIHQEIDGLLQRVAKNIANKTTKKTINPLVNDIVLAADKTGNYVKGKAVSKIAAAGYNSAYDSITKK